MHQWRQRSRDWGGRGMDAVNSRKDAYQSARPALDPEHSRWLLGAKPQGATHDRADLEPVPHRARQAGVRGLRLRHARGLRQAAGAAGDRRELRVLRRQARADPGVDQALAQFLRRGELAGGRRHQDPDRQGARQGPAGDLHHRRAARGQLGQRLVVVEEQPQRRGRAHQDQRRRQPDRRRDRARPARTS